jgi:uncharacterized protein
MTIQETITAQIKEAMKAGDSTKVITLRGLSSAFKNKALELQADSLTDEETVAVLHREAKKRKESIKVFEEAGRTELAEGEKTELAIIQEYLPQQMSEEDTKAKVSQILESQSFDNFGTAMQAVMAELKGKADANLISELVKEKLGS